MNKMDETIVVVPRKHIFGANDELAFDGVSLDPGTLTAVLERLSSGCRSMRRGDAERDPTFKQPIPYTVLVRIQEPNEIDVFAYERLAAGGEARLHGRLSIGVGGHINTSLMDQGFDEVILREAQREINEEVVICVPDPEVRPELTIVGLINDDSNDVGRVHLGILLVMTLPGNAQVQVRETDQLRGEWLPLRSALEPSVFERMETWSQLSLQAIQNWLPRITLLVV